MVLPWLLLAACATVPRDPYVMATSAMIRNDLIAALLAYDAVPVSHTFYPEARTAAVGVEGRMRRCHEMVLEALMLRAQWRDAEALELLQRARSVWPTLPSVKGLITATENRIAVFGARTEPVVPLAAPVVASLDLTPSVGPAPGVEPAPPFGYQGATDTVPGNGSRAVDESTPVLVAESSGAGDPAEPRAPLLGGSDDPVALGLVHVETRLGKGELEQAVADLLELARRFPRDTRVQLRLGRLLHQRALLRYGQGAISGAIADWERVLVIDPGNRIARNLLEAVRSEVLPAGPAPSSAVGR